MASDQKLRITNDNDDDDETIMMKVNKLIRMNPPVPLSLETPLLRLRTVAERHLRLEKNKIKQFLKNGHTL